MLGYPNKFIIKNKKKGFTLIEVMIASVILIVGILALAKIFPVITKYGRSSGETTIAANLIQAKIEEIFSLGFENISDGIIEAKHRLSTDSNNPLYNFQRQTVVEYVNINLSPSTSDSMIKKITTTVYWFNPLLVTEESKFASIVITTKNYDVNTYALNYSAGTGGSITGTTPQNIGYGGDGETVTATAITGYALTNWSDGILTASRTDTNITANKSVTANFSLNTYTLTYTAGPNGSITGTTPQNIGYGGDGETVTASPNIGYAFVSWSDGVLVPSRTDANITANKSVTASFDVATYTITASSGANGTISPAGITTKNYSTNQSYAITANTGYEIKDVLVDNVSAGKVGTYEFTNITSGHTISATFDPQCGNPIVDSRDNKSYNTVLIGIQCWLAQNLNVGTRISASSNQANNSTIEKYCYDNNEANCTTDGGLYQWNEAMTYSASCNGTGASQPVCSAPVQGICPTGWHIPSHYEWTLLERAICTSGSCVSDFPYNTNTTGYRGTNEGTRLKTGGTSGFGAILTGYRNTNGSFISRTTHTYFWSSSSGSNSWSRHLSSNTTIDRLKYDQSYGTSVRCVRN